MHQYLSNSRSNKLFHRFKCYSWDNNQFISSFSLLQSSFICWWKCQEQVRQCNSVFNIHAPPKEDNIWLIIIIIIHRLKDFSFMLGLHRVVVQNVGWNVLFRVVPVAVVIFVNCLARRSRQDGSWNNKSTFFCMSLCLFDWSISVSEQLPPTPPQTQQQSTDNKLGLMLG